MSRLPEAALTLPIYARDYQLASLWAWHFPHDTRPGVSPEVARRRSQYDLWPSPDAHNGFIWIAGNGVSGDPLLAQKRAFSCRTLEEGERASRFIFRICLPERDAGLDTAW